MNDSRVVVLEGNDRDDDDANRFVLICKAAPPSRHFVHEYDDVDILYFTSVLLVMVLYRKCFINCIVNSSHCPWASCLLIRGADPLCMIGGHLHV
jgi:hypothetical protein